MVVAFFELRNEPLWPMPDRRSSLHDYGTVANRTYIE